MRYTVFDIECDELLDAVTKIHCLSYEIYEGKVLLYKGTITSYDKMREFLIAQEILVGHNIIMYDIPVVEKILGIKPEAEAIDTLGLSWYLSPIKGFIHGLGAWGERYGIPKPVIDDWDNQSLEDYIHRCEEDVKINSKLIHEILDYLMEIYGDFDKVCRAIGYNRFKLECLKDQQDNKITLDQRLAEESKMNLEFELDERIANLGRIMPQQINKTPPKVMYKKDGELSSHGLKWLALLKEQGLPEDSECTYLPGNPGSNKQLKEWLFSLGWKPQTFKRSKATKENLAQVSLPFGGGLCPSIIELIVEHPSLKDLEGYYMIRHRAGIFKSYLENMDADGKIHARAQGFTNTYRLTHAKPIANLPGVDKYYGEQVRGCIAVPDDSYEMVGSDISGLESATGDHYIFEYDPDYVKKKREPGYDPHTAVCVTAGLMTEEGEGFFKAYVESEASDEDKTLYKRLKKDRKSGKLLNFSAVYGAGGPKIAESLKITEAEGYKLHKAYWKLNHGVKKTAKACKVKTVRGQKWLYNPVSQFWMFLKEDKDRFSTLNQSTGVYVFDTWVKFVRKRLNPLGIKILLQYHDEILLQYKKEYSNLVAMHLKEAMIEANNELKLNVVVEISVDKGNNYAECH